MASSIRLVAEEDANTINEWSMVVLQGALVPTRTTTLDDAQLGQLTYLPNGKVQMRVGHSHIVGSWSKLPKPLAVTEKRRATTQAATDYDDSATQTVEYEYHIVGIIRKKLVFNQRPTPITRKTALEDAPSKRARVPTSR